MIELRLNGATPPSVLLANTLYHATFRLDGRDIANVQWSLTAPPQPAQNGVGSFNFTPLLDVPHTLHYSTFVNGTVEESASVFNVVRRSSTVEVAVNWGKLLYAPGETLDAQVVMRDSEGNPPRSIAWRLLRNNVEVARGTSKRVLYQSASFGIYRLVASVVDHYGSTLHGEGTTFVSGQFESRSSLPVAQPPPSSVLLGSVYTHEVVGSAGEATALPYQLAAYTQDIYLLPGTTHFALDLDPQQGTVDDEVVVRTSLGNWTLRGMAGGLTTEEIGYDYQPAPMLIPAPFDQYLRLTIDAFNVHGGVFGAFNFRVRIRCYRNYGTPIYRYERCPYSTYPGGEGGRFRKFAALFTEMELVLDSKTDLNRLGSTAIETFTTENVTSVPLVRLNTSGEPNPVPTGTGLFFTDTNLFATYEATKETLQDVPMKAVAAIDPYRPCLLSLQIPGLPIISQTVKSLRGKLLLYMAGGSLDTGAVVTATVLHGKLPGSTSFQHTVTEPVYNADDDVFGRIAVLDIDLSDFQFSHTGLLVLFSVVDPVASGSDPEETIPPPMPILSDPFVYAAHQWKALRFDGACYTNPVLEPLVDSENSAGRAIELPDCARIQCGPIGEYCYVSLDLPAGTITAVQPLYFPAPFIAYGTAPTRCFTSPYLLRELTGTAAGSIAQDFLSYTTDVMCGTAYLYANCAQTGTIVVVYPFGASPHPFVAYREDCYVQGAVIENTGTLTLVSVGSVLPVLDCQDVVCTGANGTGSAVGYTDVETGQSVNVAFDGLDIGIPQFAVARERLDTGTSQLPPGEALVRFDRNPRAFLMRASVNSRVHFVVGLVGFNKKLVVVTGSMERAYPVGIGSPDVMVDVTAGSEVYLDLGNEAGLLSARTRGLRTLVIWKPVVFLPRLYDEVSWVPNGQTIQALGFCGLTNRQSYVLFRSVPFDGAVAGILNPENIVTVVSAGAEYALIRQRALGDAVPPLPGGIGWYANQPLDGTVKFRFYTSREYFGAHGEMDVWSSGTGAFPDYFQVNPYTVLALSGTGRLDGQVDDTHRNSLRVVESPAGIQLPVVYVASDGEEISIISDEPVVVQNGKTYTRKG